MPRALRFALLVAALTVFAGDAAHATRLALPEQLTTTHFVVHYDGAPVDPDAKKVLHQDAADLAGLLEQAYTHFVTNLGYPAPLDDGDGRIDVYVTDLSSIGALGVAFPDNAVAQTSGYVQIDDDMVRSSETIAHELFHLIQYSQRRTLDGYVLEGMAEWAGFNFVGFPLTVDVGAPDPTPLGDTLGAPDMSLTCSGSACGLDGYEAGGYSRWHFFQYLTERFGGQPVKDLLAKAASLGDDSGANVITAYLADKGTSLSDAFTEWTVANLTGGYSAPGLKGLAPATYATPALTGSESGTLATQKIAVNHLATRFVGFRRGSGSTGPCHAATLNLTVTLPAGVGSRPYFHWSAPGSTPVPLAVSGSTATASVPWDTCTWLHTGYLALPNPTVAVDGALFTVASSITVDKKKLATSVLPPTGRYTGPTVPAPTAEEPPTIALYGPETLRVSRKSRVLRLVVFAGSDGKLDVRLGGLALGERKLRTGNNDLRFKLPATAFRALSSARVKRATQTLTVTSLAPNGSRGDSLTRKLLLTK